MHTNPTHINGRLKLASKGIHTPKEGEKGASSFSKKSSNQLSETCFWGKEWSTNFSQEAQNLVETHLQSLHELPCARLGNGTQVVDQVGLGHPDASVTDGECVVVLVGDNGDLHLLLRLQDCWIGQTLVPDLVQSLGVEDNIALFTCKIRLIIVVDVPTKGA
jgi:hypothetical protein